MIRATLLTLGQWLPAGNPEDLAASLPIEIKWYLTGAVHEHGQRFDSQEFACRVSEIEGVDRPEVAYHTPVIMGLVERIGPALILFQRRGQLPKSEAVENWPRLFAVIAAGGWGDARALLNLVRDNDQESE